LPPTIARQRMLNRHAELALAKTGASVDQY
jgi:hypothetical protein